MDKWWNAGPELVGKTASELELQHVRKGRNIVSLSAVRHRQRWNRYVRENWGGDDNAA